MFTIGTRFDLNRTAKHGRFSDVKQADPNEELVHKLIRSEPTAARPYGCTPGPFTLSSPHKGHKFIHPALCPMKVGNPHLCVFGKGHRAMISMGLLDLRETASLTDN